MLNSTVITVVGNLTDNPEFRFTPSGVAMARFTVAVNPRVFDKRTGEWRDGEASFYNCTAWRQLAENTAQSLAKGIRVIVTGTIAQQRWETEQGEKRSTFAVTAEAVGPDLSYATATVRKTVRSGNDQAGTDDPWASASPNRPAAPTAVGTDRRSPNNTEPAAQPGRMNVDGWRRADIESALSGGRRESRPPAPTDPGVNLSAHRALVILITSRS